MVVLGSGRFPMGEVPLQWCLLKREMLSRVGICEVIVLPLEPFYLKLAHELGTPCPGALDEKLKFPGTVLCKSTCK